MVQSKKVISLIVLTLGIHCVAAVGHAAERWVAVEGDGFKLITDAGVPVAQRMARRVIEMRRLLGGSTKVVPLRVVLTASGSLFDGLRPSSNSAAFYQSGADEDWIVTLWGRSDSERALSHELVHAFLEHNGPRRPLWLEEGLAEFYSTAHLEAKGWIIGQPVDSHVRALNNVAWLGEREFFEARPDSPLHDEKAREGLFYGQSWAVIHYILTTPGMREKTPAFFEALSDGMPFARACEGILGQRPGILIESARQAVEHGHFLTARIAGDPVPKPTTAAAMTTEESDAILVSLALAAGRPGVAGKAARSPAQRGLLALRTGNLPEAETLLAGAVAENSPDPAAYFELAMLLRDGKREPERVAALLRQTLERNPNHAEAHFILGLRAAAAGDDEGAIDYYQTAAQILPRQANFWHALALALERAHRRAEAAHAALRCRQAARNQAEREMAAAIERLVKEPEPRIAVVKKPDVEVPKSWQGLRGDATVDGHLTDFDCAGTPPVARITAANEQLSLRVEKPNAIRISGTGSVQHTLTCGPQKTAVRVEFLRRTNVLTAIEFK